MIKQCKGKDISKVPIGKLQELYYASIKRDGNYIQVEVDNTFDITMKTSGDKEFYISEFALECKLLPIGVYEFEYTGSTEGLLGDRTKSSTGTYRAKYKHNNISYVEKAEANFYLFDIINDKPFIHRLKQLEAIDYSKFNHIKQVEYNKYSLERAKEKLELLLDYRYEGFFLKAPNHMQLEGKRVNEAIKLKGRATADLICLEVSGGTGKYVGKIGSLVLQDSKGREVEVGSGLTDKDRSELPIHFIGKVIEIGYEQIIATYIQPTFIRIRNDKTIKDID